MPGDEQNNIPIECLGVTGAVNFLKPDKQELVMTQQLEQAISNLNIFESVEETRQRREALIELQDHCNQWIYNKAIEYMYPETVAKSIKGKIFTFGSYRLGVNFRGADIDALLIAPKFISRDEFFDDFVAFLSDNELAQEIHAVPKAFVPVLKMKFNHVEIDLLFASVDLMSIPRDFSLSDNSETLLRNMDERDVRSVNGVRVTDDILRLVFDKRVFKSALKIVRIWAKRRCIYSNAMGFIGGVSWAILVARVCQLWPLATVATVVVNFFKFYGLKWRWPSPVVLREVEDMNIAGLQLTQWDPRVNPADQLHLMPIVTPSYPAQNSTYNVCDSHRRFIVEQMKQALKVLGQILQKEKSFQDLFKPLFFFTYRHYLVVTFRCLDKKQFREDTSLIESKLRLLVQFLESNVFVEFALLYLRSFDRVESDKGESYGEGIGDGVGTGGGDQEGGQRWLVRRWFIGLDLKKVEKNLYLVEEITRFKNMVRLDLDVSYSRRANLAPFLPSDVQEAIRERALKERLSARKRNSDSSSGAAAATTATPAAPVSTNANSNSVDNGNDNASTDNHQTESSSNHSPSSVSQSSSSAAAALSSHKRLSNSVIDAADNKRTKIDQSNQPDNHPTEMSNHHQQQDQQQVPIEDIEKQEEQLEQMIKEPQEEKLDPKDKEEEQQQMQTEEKEKEKEEEEQIESQQQEQHGQSPGDESSEMPASSNTEAAAD